MPFVRQKIDDKYATLIARDATPLWGMYGGDWSVALDTGDCMYFWGCDQLDPTIPSTFILLKDERKTRLRLEVLAADRVPSEFREGFGKFQDLQSHFFAVLTDIESLEITDFNVQDLARQAFCVLTEKEVCMTFISNWKHLNEIQTRLEVARGIALASQTTHKPLPQLLPAWVSKIRQRLF